MKSYTELASTSTFFGKDILRYLFSLYLRILPIRYMNYWLFLNPTDTGIAIQLMENIYEIYSNDVINKLTIQNPNIVDIGAHIGSNTLFFSKIAGVGGHVFCFEPDPNNFNLLNKNLCVNRIKNSSSYRIAISNKKGNVDLYSSKEETTDHRISKMILSGRKTIKVKCDSLDNLLCKVKHIDLIKIDVQGWEIKCIEGMKKIIKKNKNLSLIIEYWPKGLKEAGFEPKDLLNLLKKMHLKLYILDEINRKTIYVVNNSMLAKYTRNGGFVNLLCKKR